MRRTLLVIGAATVLLAGACGSPGHRSTAPTVATAPLPSSTTTSTTLAPTTPSDPTSTAPATTTTTVPDTTTVPRRITVAYVDAVLARLNHLYGDAVRSTVAAHRLTEFGRKDLQAIYSPRLAAEEDKIFLAAVSAGLTNLRRHPGDRVTRVLKLISASETCIYAKVDTTFGATDIHQVKLPADEFIGLKQEPARHSPEINRTAWVFFFDLTNYSRTNVPDQCHGTR